MKEIVMSRHQIYFRYFTLFASLILPAFHAIAEDVENPMYTNWAKFAIGTSVTNKAVTPIGRYAIRIAFDDGHDTGLYTWESLHRIGRDRLKLETKHRALMNPA